MKNPHKRSFCLLHCDNGVVTSPNIKKCDCAFFADSYMGFIEFKTNVVTVNTSTKVKRYGEAAEQPEATIDKFKSVLPKLNIGQNNLAKAEAYICFSKKFVHIESPGDESAD